MRLSSQTLSRPKDRGHNFWADIFLALVGRLHSLKVVNFASWPSKMEIDLQFLMSSIPITPKTFEAMIIHRFKQKSLKLLFAP